MTVERASKVIGICPSALRRLNNSEKLFTSSLSRLTFGECHHRLCMFRPLRGVLARRRKGGAGPAPAGVVRSCTPGRTPEQTRQLLRAGPGPGTVERESGKSRWRAGQARFFFWRLLWRATPPRLGEREKRRANPKPDQTWG